MQKSISVIIPVYNAQRTLNQCLDSLFKNNYQDFEVIVVNDCSSDGSVEIMKRYPAKIINLAQQRGPAFARNNGLSLAGGEIIAFLDSDCLVSDDWLSKINTKLTKNILGLGGKYDLPKEINDLHRLFITYWDLKNIFYRRPTKLISLSGGNCIFWKSGLRQERKKKELVYCHRRLGGEDTIMCSELEKFGRLIYDPGLSVIHNKQCSWLNILKETIHLGYSGATVTGVCASSLIKEPHRFYKSILYLFSLLLFLSALLLPFTKAGMPCLYLLIFYVAMQLPIIFLIGKQLSNPMLVLFVPVVIFASDLLHSIGYLKRGYDLVRGQIRSFLWYSQLLLNAINPSRLSRIFLFVTKKCNATCYFCFNKQDKQIDQKEDLSLEEIKNISSKIGFLPWLTITGGEPFLRNDIYQICRSFYSHCRTRIISIATNGILTSRIEDVAEKLLLDCDRLYLTIIVALDDLDQGHDKLKGREGCYRQALGTLEKLRSLQLRFPRLTLAINTIIIKENVSRLEEILDYFGNNLYYNRQCLNLYRQPPCTSVDPGLISIQKYLNLVKTRIFPAKPAVRSNSLKQKFNQAAVEYLCDKSLEEFKQKKSLDCCLAAQKFFVINNNGNVYACELLSEELGNLRKAGYDFQKIKNNSKVKEIRAKIDNSSCYCQWGCAIATNGYFNLFSYPRIIKRIIQPFKNKLISKDEKNNLPSLISGRLYFCF